MTISYRLYAGIVVFTILLIVLLVLGGRGGALSEYQLSPFVEAPPAVNRIAYVTPDGQIHTINPDGSDARLISDGEGFFTWPTWSPDAKSLIFSGVVERSSQTPRISLFAASVPEGEWHEIFAGEPGVVGLLAEGVVHYPLWSPDSQRVAFIAVTSRGLTLLLDDLADDSAAQFVLDNGPMWISWSPDSLRLLAHRGNEHFIVDTAEGVNVTSLELLTGNYRVPAWNPSRGGATLASGNQFVGYTVFDADVSGGGLVARQTFAEFSRTPVFLWSPDGRYLAAADYGPLLTYQGFTFPVYQDLRIIPQDGQSQPIVIRDNVLAYFWSPDSAKLAYVSFSPDARNVVTWRVLDTRSGAVRVLADFIPSLDQLIPYQFFDQYAYSHSPWSPDSESLVFSGRLGTEAVPASLGNQAATPNIIIADTGPSPRVRLLAEGVMGFWSPR
ncbi:MAG: hypothetical protein L0177_15875 [Chloroflexi bacterium]|nr:hypothetical protein [Chloroflexota bacterium]